MMDVCTIQQALANESCLCPCWLLTAAFHPHLSPPCSLDMGWRGLEGAGALG